MKRRRIKKRSSGGVVWKKQVFIGVVLFVVVGLLVTAVWHVTRLPALTIDEIVVQEGKSVAQKDVQKIIEDGLHGEYYKLVPRRFVLTYPQEALERAVAEIPRVKTAVVQREGKTVRVAYQEYKPHALWCPERETKHCLFVDTQGYAFSPAPALRGSLFLHYSTRERELRVGEVLADEATLQATEAMVEILKKEFKFPVVEVVFDRNEVRYRIFGGGEIVTLVSLPVEESVSSVRTILQSKELSHLKPGNFEYIDVSLGNKVFVNQITPEEEAERTGSAEEEGEEIEAVEGGEESE